MEDFVMEQLSLFKILLVENSKKKIDFTADIHKELICAMSEAIINVYREREERKNHETDKSA